MRVIVLGAGLMGVTSAHALWRDGHEVTVVERAARPASATSHANAGLISASRALPWPAPGVWRTLVRGLVERNTPWRIDWAFDTVFDPAFWHWGAQLLALSNVADHDRLARAKLAFAADGHRALRDLIAETGIACGYRAQGLVYVCRSAKTRAAAEARSAYVARHGVRLAVIAARQAAQIEPALEAAVAQGTVIAASYAPEDGQGDARRFTEALARWLAGRGVGFRYGTAATDLRLRGRRVTQVVLADGTTLDCDAVVAALGPYVGPVIGSGLSDALGEAPPIHPVKGFSMTVPVRDPARAPQLGGICEDTLVAWCPVDDGRSLRLTTGANFGARDTAWRAEDFEPHRCAAESLWPGLLDWESPAVERWACLRPMTPSSLPFIGRGSFENLWWNAGQGHIGWTMCAGSANVLADVIGGRTPRVPLDDFGRL